MSTIVADQIWGELLRDGKTVYRVKLDIHVRELFANESAMPIGRAIVPRSMKLSRMSGLAVEDGEYTLRYAFDGEVEEDRVRVKDATLLGG